MFLIASVAFFIAGFTGEDGSDATFIVLGAVFLILALNVWRSTKR
jgi:hypothetical protein